MRRVGISVRRGVEAALANGAEARHRDDVGAVRIGVPPRSRSVGDAVSRVRIAVAVVAAVVVGRAPRRQGNAQVVEAGLLGRAAVAAARRLPRAALHVGRRTVVARHVRAVRRQVGPVGPHVEIAREVALLPVHVCAVSRPLFPAAPAGHEGQKAQGSKRSKDLGSCHGSSRNHDGPRAAAPRPQTPQLKSTVVVTSADPLL
jgi:hypothetical protein